MQRRHPIKKDFFSQGIEKKVRNIESSLLRNSCYQNHKQTNTLLQDLKFKSANYKFNLIKYVRLRYMAQALHTVLL